MNVSEIEQRVTLEKGSYVAMMFTIDDAKEREYMKENCDEPFVDVTPDRWAEFVSYIRAQQSDWERKDWDFFESEWDCYSETFDD